MSAGSFCLVYVRSSSETKVPLTALGIVEKGYKQLSFDVPHCIGTYLASCVTFPPLGSSSEGKQNLNPDVHSDNGNQTQRPT